jgi:asparagine synthase (glutamine-hydrolysing)
LVEAEVLKPEGGWLLSKGTFPPEAVCPLSFKALILEQWCRQMRKIALGDKNLNFREPENLA